MLTTLFETVLTENFGGASFSNLKALNILVVTKQNRIEGSVGNLICYALSRRGKSKWIPSFGSSVSEDYRGVTTNSATFYEVVIS